MDGFESWQDALHAALIETNPNEVRTRIRTAEAAIFQRIQTFTPRNDSVEEQALFNALGTLRVLSTQSVLWESNYAREQTLRKRSKTGRLQFGYAGSSV